MSNHPLLSFADPAEAAQPGAMLEHARGLAQLAFGSFSRVTEFTQTRHLALLPPESLELDLNDPAQRQFGDYELLELLGEGGMGVVYRARQISLDREVAVKLLSAGPWASRDFVARFEREAQNAARMQHPNIVTVYEVGSFEGLQFFSMRLVRGSSLSSRLKHGERFAPKAAAALMRTVAEAVGYAHSLGVLHLDLKPANVLLDEAGTPYVADFGLARRLENALAIENDEVSGTPAYMAPEQAQVRAHKLTKATDIWGLGAILYELLTGHPPFRAETAQDTVKLVLEGQVRAPRRWEPALPLDLEAIVLRCLNRNPGERYASARALADDLARYVEGRPVQARPLNTLQRMVRWAKREPKLATAAGCAVAILLVGLAATTMQWRRADASANVARENLWSTRAQTAQQALAGGDGFHGLRPLVANLAEMEGAHREAGAAIERQRIGTILANAPQLVDLIRLPSGERATSVAIAPDGRHFAVATAANEWGGGPHYIRQFELDTLRQTWSTAADHRTFLMAAGDAGAPLSGLRYTADGRFLLVSLIEQPVVPAPRTADMIAFDVRDGRVLWPEGLPQRQSDIVYDDAARIALVRFRSDPSLRWPDSAQFYEVDGWKAIGPRHSIATTLAADVWLPSPKDGAWLGTRDSARFAMYDVPSLQPRWQLQLSQTSLVRAWQFSHDGRWLALGSVDGSVRLVDAASGRSIELGSSPTERVLNVEFSSDDRMLAAIDELGQLRVWETATRLPLFAPIPFVRTAAGARLRFTGHALYGGGLLDRGNAELNLVGLPRRAPFNIGGAVTLSVRLRGSNFGTAFDVSHPACRLVLGAGDGLVEVWTLPISPVLAVRAAPLVPDVQTFDGAHVVAVDGNTVSVVEASGEKPDSPLLQFPEPVRFAELSPDGRTLATIAGRTVRIIDANTWRLRGAPILLPQTPKRAVFAHAAPLLVLTTTDYVGGVLRERIHRIDLEKGAMRAGPDFDALTDFALDEHGRYALLASWNSASHAEAGPRRVALDDGAVSCVPKVDGPTAMALAGDGGSAWFAIGTSTGTQLQRWDLHACRKIAESELPGTQDVVLQARGNGLAVHRGGKEALILIGADGKREAALGEAIPGAMHAFALSTDGGRAAFATRNSVQIIDAHQGRRLSGALGGPIDGDDGIAKLVFSHDGTRLLGRTINGRWMVWKLPPTRLSPDALGRLVQVLDPDPAQTLAASDLRTLRKELRFEECPPLAWPASGSAVAFASVPGAEADARFVPLDLRPAINIPLLGVVWPEPNERGDRPTLAPGLQRFLGVDYRVDGGVQLIGGGTATALGPELHRSAVVAVPDVVARRLHVLAFMHIPMERGVPPRTFAHVALIGADGRETPLEIRTVRDVATDVIANRGAPGAHIAFSGVSSAFVRGGESAEPMSNVYAVSLDVPPGTGPIRGLRFDVADGPMEAPLFYAATLERATPAAVAANPPRIPGN